MIQDSGARVKIQKSKIASPGERHGVGGNEGIGELCFDELQDGPSLGARAEIAQADAVVGLAEVQINRKGFGIAAIDLGQGAEA